MHPTPPCRLYVHFASEARVGIVIRRGPSKHVCTLLWDRDRDTFQLGQWLKGRIYEQRSHLSPDGQHFLYCVLNGRWESETRGAYTAISRAPYLKAISLYPHGETWGGGGAFIDCKSFYHETPHGCGREPLRETPSLTHIPWDPYSDEQRPDMPADWEALLRYRYPAWSLVPKWNRGAWQSHLVIARSLPHGWELRRIFSMVPSRSGESAGHELVHAGSQKRIAHPDWEWADWDRTRIVWAKGGRIFAGNLCGEGIADERELIDLNPLKFAAIKSPY